MEARYEVIRWLSKLLFRDSVRNRSSLAKPLQDTLEGYSTKDSIHKTKWTDKLDTAFMTIKDAVSNCQKLYFKDESSEIYQ